MTSIVVGTTDKETVRRLVVPTGIITFAVAALLSVTNADSASEAAVEVVVQAAVAAVVFGLVVPRALRHEGAGGRGLVMGVLALLLVMPAFWSGLPLLLGSGAALVGQAGRHAERGSGKAIASLVVGLLAVVGYVAVYVLDYLHTHGIG
jgi:ABC-type spermidine/putrescine transport system permease subunit II